MALWVVVGSQGGSSKETSMYMRACLIEEFKSSLGNQMVRADCFYGTRNML